MRVGEDAPATAPVVAAIEAVEAKGMPTAERGARRPTSHTISAINRYTPATAPAAAGAPQIGTSAKKPATLPQKRAAQSKKAAKA
ncbi:hypothetical protein GCM10007276_29590 [Agaricicola taiwanensis]|uniref:Uncharacterized protein n=1 Tax=Agaricicola taiwanensis TaxID=591372 RepID=A0A8J2YLB9_9RHOB|nr:hypothetical protein GCM10007276_29590 [Agaricicola taiwanensis]